MKSNINKKGFTLIELLIVVTIIAILAGIALVSLGPAQKAGRDARRLGDVRAIQTLIQLYYNRCANYPGAADCTCPATNPAGGLNDPWWGLAADGSGGVANLVAGRLGIPVGQMPREPLSTKDYRYAINQFCTSYVVAAEMETGPEALRTDIDGVQASNGNLDCGAAATDLTYCVSL